MQKEKKNSFCFRQKLSGKKKERKPLHPIQVENALQESKKEEKQKEKRNYLFISFYIELALFPFT